MDSSPWGGLLVASLTLIIVLIVSHMCVQLFKLRHPSLPRDRFQSCSSHWLADRRAACAGVSSGQMPSIDDDG